MMYLLNLLNRLDFRFHANFFHALLLALFLGGIAPKQALATVVTGPESLAGAASSLTRSPKNLAPSSTSRMATLAGLVSLPDGRILAQDIAAILQRGELVVALNHEDNPPFVEVRNGVLTGSDVQLMTDLAREMKVTVRFDRTSTTFDGVIDMVVSGKADVGVGKLARTLARAQRVAFTDTYQRIDHALLVNRLAMARIARSRPFKDVVRSFNGSIAVIQGSAWEEFGRVNFPDAKIVPMANWEKAVESTRRGETVAAYRDEFEVRRVLKQDPALALTLRAVTFEDAQSHLAVAVALERPSLRAYISEFLAVRSNRMPRQASPRTGR